MKARRQKPSQSQPAGLRKKRTPPKKGRIEPQDMTGARDAYDRATDFLYHIRTLAELLEASGMCREAEALDARTVSRAGSMIRDEAGRLREALETIHRNL